MNDISARLSFAIDLVQIAGDAAREYFFNRDQLDVDQKGSQDWVSDADRNIELLLRDHISKSWPADGVVGEEQENTVGTSGFDWVIDPIDGTTNFVNGIPAWTIVLAGVQNGKTQIGIIHDQLNNETFVACRDGGATLNGQKIQVAADTPLESGTIAVGYSNRVKTSNVVPVVEAITQSGAMFHRNASGALSLAYVAAGRLLGYLEEHMNAWDCLAGQLLIEEAGGVVEQQNADEMIRKGGRVIVGTPEVFDQLKKIALSAWNI